MTHADRLGMQIALFVLEHAHAADGLKQILIEKARAGIEVRLLYDPQGSQAHVGRR